ncbi:MAG: S9 family peptidase [Deltaproteobacteria bacterium]|nr:S9 family peptidase [Deltaproteobacteria bacterium]
MSRSLKTLLFCVAGLSACRTLPPPPPPPPPPRIVPGPPPPPKEGLILDGVPAVPARMREQMNPYLNVRGAYFLDWDEKGTGLLVATRFGNTTQVHRVASPGADRQQLTFFPEPVDRATYVRGSFDGALLLLMDQGGNENLQLHRVDLLEGKISRLTAATARTTGFEWSLKGALAYNSNARNGRDFDIYVAKPGEVAAAKRVLEPKGMWSTAAFSPDEQSLLLVEFVSLNETYLHLLDLRTRKLRALTPKGPRPVAYRSALFAPDGKGLYVTSDRDGEYTQLYYLELASGKLTPLSAKQPWNVEELEISPDGKTLAVVLNEDGYSRLHLMNTRSQKFTPVKLPDGILSRLHFSRRQPGLLGFSLEQPTAPSDVFSYDLKRRKLTQWTHSEVGGLNRDFLVTPTLVRYPTFDAVEGKPRKIPAFYYRPPGDGPHPVVIHIHGGPEAQFRPNFLPLLQYWAMELGVAVIAPNVRGSDGYGRSYLLLDNGRKREDSVRDIGALLDWIGKQKELDARRVMVHGGSYGGYMVLASLVRYGQRIAAGIDWVGISNFVTFLESTQKYRRDLRRAEYGDESAPSMRKFLQEISPLSHTEKIVSPLLVFQGANDPRVPKSESDQLVRAVRKNGRAVWYVVGADEGHGFRKRTNLDQALQITGLFTEQIAPRGKAGDKP